jgi:prepilin-type processing-associated H-X9-DG protein
MPIPVACECGHLFEASEAEIGLLAPCPVCGRKTMVAKPAPPSEVLFIPWEPEPTTVSGKAIASLAFGVLFFFACLTGLPAIILGQMAVRDIERSGGRLKGWWLATAGIVLGIFGCLFTIAFFLPAVRSARESARRAQCVSNLKCIGLLLHNYHDDQKALPPAAITDKAGRPLLSWRVAILPYIGGDTLQAKFHLDEPWDSPHNLTLLDRMPSIYACPSDMDRKPGMTGYQAIIGPQTAFPPDFKPLRLEDFTDGTSNTILVGETRRLVPWTKPEDLAFDLTIPLSGLGSHHGYHNNGFNVLLADGSVKFLKSSINRPTLTSLLTRNGNEVWADDSF